MNVTLFYRNFLVDKHNKKPGAIFYPHLNVVEQKPNSFPRALFRRHFSKLIDFHRAKKAKEPFLIGNYNVIKHRSLLRARHYFLFISVTRKASFAEESDAFFMSLCKYEPS